VSGAPFALGALAPPQTAEAAPFWEGVRAGLLRVQRCAATGRLFFPPRPTSPFAPRVPPEWVPVSGRGTIWSWCVPHPPLLPPFAALAPYAVVAVALAEDPRVRMVGNLVARAGGSIAEVAPATLAIGAAVEVVFENAGEERVLPRWRVVTSARRRIVPGPGRWG
jgi:uncharacterized OB-fold protein